MTDLVSVARALVAPGKGILAADESIQSADKRLAAHGIHADPGMRRKFRELFLEMPLAEQYLSGVILFSETFTQHADNGATFPQSLASRGIGPGIKVDLGTEPFAESPDELITNGLLGLPERLAEFKKGGATFAKWRAVVTIDGDRLPSAQAIHENLKRLATYAKQVQEAGLVPILEPEVLLEGKHSRARAKAVLQDTLGTLFAVLKEHSVDRKAVILKTAMALSGNKSGKTDTSEEVAEDTVGVLIETVPADVAGIVFLSGGQTPDQATENLAAITRRAREVRAPWPLTFSYARALQDEALNVWQGKEENVPAARQAFLERLKKTCAALAADALTSVQ